MAGRITVATVGGNRVSAQNYRSGLASCEFCGVRLIRVRGIPRENGPIEPFYRLAPGRNHGICRYNETRRINRIVEFSIGFTGVEPIVRDRRGRAVFRLGVVGEALRQLKHGQLPDPIRDGGGNITITATRVQRQLLRTAKSVLGLAARVDDLPELGNLISLTNNGNEIRWRDFFYKTDSMQRLFSFVQNPVAFPIAFEIRVRAVYPPRHNEDNYMISCEATRATHRGSDCHFSPTLWIRDAAIAATLAEQGSYLILAQPDSLRQNKGYHNLHVTISSRHQICRY